MRDSENLWTERATLVHGEERESAQAPGNVRADLRELKLERIRGRVFAYRGAVLGGTLAVLKKIMDLTADVSLSE